MSDNLNSNNVLSGTQPTDVVNLPKLRSRKDLAAFLKIKHKKLTYILYHLDRSTFYREIVIKKSSGEPRQLHAVHGPLKWLQREALDRFQEAWSPTVYSHGFTPERSIITNASFHRRKKMVIKVDLEDFFPSITFPRVQGMFKAPPFRFGNEAATTMAQMACLDTDTSCLPQGGVLSPYISNMMCRRLDKRLARLAQEHRCHFTRYADDITFSTNNTKGLVLKEFLAKTRKIIESENFRVNEAKTRAMTPKDRQVVTGIIVNDGLNVNRRYYRNIRATLYNCEKSGIESQLLKLGGFTDPRSSRPRLASNLEGRSAEERSDHNARMCWGFLRHLLGKIEFVGQVVLSEEQKENPATLQRVRLYEKLLYRFYKLVESELLRLFKQPESNRESEKIKRFQQIEKMVLSRIAKRPRMSEQLTNREERRSVRQKALRKHRNDPATHRKLEQLANTKYIEDILQLVEVFAKNDPRFFGLKVGANFQKSRQRIHELLRYPAWDREKTFHFLDSFRNSKEGMGVFVHNNPDFTTEKGYEILKDQYDPVCYFLPAELKKIVEGFITKFDELAVQVGASEPVDVMHDERISDATTRLKLGTRFGKKAAGDTQLKGVLEASVKYALKECPDRKDVQFNIDKADGTRFYTDVATIKRVTELLFHSMLKNTRGDRIVIQAGLDPNDEGFFVLMVFDNANVKLDGSATRDFVSGKLSEVVRLSNGLCDYHIEADFDVNGRVCLDMHDGEIVHCKARQKTGFTHILRFRRK
ncbi:reverse transcriptase domain-containing protein [Pseudomonadota bacterium]